jgi:outer membrane protein insertion porin family
MGFVSTMSAACRGFAAVFLTGFAFVASTLVLPTAATAETSPSAIRVDRIEIQGAQRIEDETIRSYLRIAEGDVVTRAAVNGALKRLFATGLFRDVRITPRGSEDARGGRTLLVVVVENPVINAISFEGNRRIDDEILQAQIRSRLRGAFTRARAEADAQTILDAYRAAGRYSATVEPKIIKRDRNRIDLVFEISEGDEVGVSAINFVGNTAYSDRRLRGAIMTSESGWWKLFASADNYDPDRLEFDKQLLRRFYFARGFADFEVLSAVAELGPERDGFFITFTVNEGEQYENGEVQLLSNVIGVDPETYTHLIETDRGDTYDADLVERSIRSVLNAATEDGVNFINVRPEAKKRVGEDGTPLIDIIYRIIDAPKVYVDRIEITGNSRTLDKVVRREFEFAEGDAFNAYWLQRSRDNIRSLGFFSEVDVKTRRGAGDDRVIVDTTVVEQSTGDISFGIGFSTAESFGGDISLTERNFLGRGQFVRASASLTADRQYFDFRFTEPYFLDRNLRVGFNIFHAEVDNQDSSSFDSRRTGFKPRVGFSIDENSKIDFSYLIENSTIRGVPTTASPLIQTDAESRLVSAVGYDYQLDFRDSKNQPTEGFVLRLGQDFAGLGGDALYVKTEGSVKGYQSFFREELIASLEIAGGGLFGFGSDEIKVNDRFFLGGNSFRGFESSGIGPRDTNRISLDTNGDNRGDRNQNIDDALGGNYYAISRADLSFPLGLPEEYGIHGGLFMDAGAVWGLDDNSYSAFNQADPTAAQRFSVDDDIKIRAAAGASIFWRSPFGPIRFNFAKPILKEDNDRDEFFRFTAGTRF